MKRAAAPLITVVLPVRNGLPYISLAVDGVLAQTLPDFELLIVDDGSSDGTAEYLQSLEDARVTIVEPDESGLAAALNTGVRLARSAYLARHDADDRSAPDRLARQIAFLNARPDVAVLATCANYIDHNGQQVDDAWTRTVRTQQDLAQTPDEIRALLPLTCCITHGSVMARTDVLRRHGYRADAVPAEDYDLWLRLIPEERIAKLPDRLYDYRVHATQSGALRRTDQTARAVEAKLRFLRRQAPDLRRPTRLVLPCDDRGARIFRAVATSEEYQVLLGSGPIDLVDRDDVDVVAVTDFEALAGYAAALSARYAQLGNLFVRRRERRP